MTEPTVPGDHDWHPFNEELGLQVARVGEAYAVRRMDHSRYRGVVVALTPETWDAWRAGGPGPEELR